eukprot:9503960-Pyramimonas_sp.AAC.1
MRTLADAAAAAAAAALSSASFFGRGSRARGASARTWAPRRTLRELESSAGAPFDGAFISARNSGSQV